MNYSFDIEDAKMYGVDEAIMLYNIKFWVMKNKANEKNQFEIEIDGKIEIRTWTFNSHRAFSELFPFWSTKQIRRIMNNLEVKGAVLSGNYNKIKYDRTKWYALKHESLSPNGQMNSTKQANKLDQTVQPIPDINTDINTDKDNYFLNEILNYWNSKTLQNHKLKTVKLHLTNINLNKIKEYNIDNIKKSIDNYEQITLSPDYYYNHRGTLWNFIKKYYINFVEDAKPHINFSNNKKQISSEIIGVPKVI